MLVLIAVATIIAIATQRNFDMYFSDMLSIMVYILVPWSAINLADYYLVRKGQYTIADMFKLDGIYGRYRWRAIGVYLAGIVIQAPFISLSFYTGSIARSVGADLAWLPGFAVPAIVFCIVERHGRHAMSHSAI